MEAGTPRFVRGTDAGGRLPVSTIVLGALLVALLIGAVVAVRLGLIR